MPFRKLLRSLVTASFFAVTTLALLSVPAVSAQTDPDIAKLPWMNKALAPDQRADMVLEQMTLDEKIALVHGSGNATGASDGGAAGFRDCSQAGSRRQGIHALAGGDRT